MAKKAQGAVEDSVVEPIDALGDTMSGSGDVASALRLLEQRVAEMHRPFGTVLPQVGFSRREMTYCGLDYDPGQLLRLQGARGDEKLFRIGYIQDLPPRFDLERDTVQCGTCGAEFLSHHYLELHGDKRHTLTCVCGAQFGFQTDLDTHALQCSARRQVRRQLILGG